MIDAFAEGARSVGQACQLVILAPVAAMIVAARGRWSAVGGAVAGVVLGGWSYATGWSIVGDGVLRWSAVVVVLAVCALTLSGFAGRLADVPARSRTGTAIRHLSRPVAVGAIAATGAVIVAQWWRPCVGEQLGVILSRAPDDPLGQLPGSVAFMLGVSLPLFAIGSLFAALAPSERSGERIAVAAGAVGLVLVGSVAVGHHGEIVARLVEWSA